MTVTQRRSPWGVIQDEERIATGITFVSTSSHGGIKLDRRRQAMMPKVFRQKGGWYEEDCDWCLPALIFPEAFPDKQTLAHSTAKDWHPEAYEAHFGVVISLSESVKKREVKFQADTVDKWVVTAAWGSWHAKVPVGMVGVVASLGGIRDHSVLQRYFLVPQPEYSGRGVGFVVDLERHQEVAKL